MREEEGNQKRKGKAVAILRNLPRIKRKETRKAALEIKKFVKNCMKSGKIHQKRKRDWQREREEKEICGRPAAAATMFERSFNSKEWRKRRVFKEKQEIE